MKTAEELTAELAEKNAEIEAIKLAQDAGKAKAKESLNAAFAERDAARAEAAKMKEAADKAATDKLLAEGKETEALKLQLEAANAAAAALRSTNQELVVTRTIDTALAALEFASVKSRGVMARSIREELVVSDDGKLSTKDGKELSELVAAFAKDPENAFLFKVKTNSGTGSTTSTSSHTHNNTAGRRTPAEIAEDVRKRFTKG
jgi:hypothetical protein